MIAQLRRSLLMACFVMLCASAAWSQVTTMEGYVKDANGQPLKGALVKLERTDIKGHYQVKSDKHGKWFYTGLPFGIYNVSCEVDGKVIDEINGVHTKYSDATEVNFDAAKAQAQNAALQQAAATGSFTKEQERSMTPEQRAALEKEMKERSETMKKNKELNDEFNAGMTAEQAKDYPTAEQHFLKASQLDPTQIAVWNGLGDTYYAMAKAQAAPQQGDTYEKAVAAYKKSLELKPDSSGLYIQLGNIYGAEKKFPEAKDAYAKAAQMDPTNAAKSYFNLGAIMVNNGDPDGALEAFKKCVEVDPNYAEAQFQLGTLLMAKGSVDPKTGQQSYPPGTGEALQKYLSLQPNGAHAAEATAMLTALGQKVETTFKNPDTAKPKKKR